MEFTYQIIEDKKLIIEIYKGDITLDFLKKSIIEEFIDPKFTKLKYGVCDLRQANLKLTNKQVKEFFDFSVQHDQNKLIKWATVTANTKNTAIAMIMELESVNYYGYKTFSTLEAISVYLGIPVSEEMFTI